MSKSFKSPKPFHDRVVLVTGASRGIGRACVLAFAARGAHVIALARTQGSLEELDDAARALGGEPLTLVPADLRDFDAIDRLGAVIRGRWGRLDGLVANAGVLGPATPAAQIAPEEWDEVIDINLTANMRLVRATDDLLRASTAGRAVFLTSHAARFPRAYMAAYAASKGGLETFVASYAAELVNTTVRVNSLDPGGTRTDMRAQAYPDGDRPDLNEPADVAESIIAMLAPAWDGSGNVLLHPVEEGNIRISDKGPTPVT